MDIVQESILKAAGFTVIVMMLGVLIGLQMDDLRQGHLQDELEQSQIQSETLTILESYMQRSDEGFCELMDVQMPEVTRRTTELGVRLENFDEQGIEDDEYERIRDRYYNNQLRLYMASERYRESCERESDDILYFFDDSSESQQQGAVLDEIVERNGVQVFAFNAEVDNMVVDTLKADYNITENPTLVLNGEKKVEGFVSEGELRNEYLN